MARARSGQRLKWPELEVARGWIDQRLKWPELEVARGWSGQSSKWPEVEVARARSGQRSKRPKALWLAKERHPSLPNVWCGMAAEYRHSQSATETERAEWTEGRAYGGGGAIVMGTTAGVPYRASRGPSPAATCLDGSRHLPYPPGGRGDGGTAQAGAPAWWAPLHTYPLVRCQGTLGWITEGPYHKVQRFILVRSCFGQSS